MNITISFAKLIRNNSDNKKIILIYKKLYNNHISIKDYLKRKHRFMCHKDKNKIAIPIFTDNLYYKL